MNILFLTHRIPYPPDKGDKIRSYNEIKYLSQKHRIYLGFPLEKDSDMLGVSHLEGMCEHIFFAPCPTRWQMCANILAGLPFTVAHFHQETLQGMVNEVIATRGIEAIIVFCSGMAQYVLQNPAFSGRSPQRPVTIMDFVDLDSDKWFQYAQYSHFPRRQIFQIENHRLSHYENQISQKFDASVFISPREIEAFRRHQSTESKLFVIPNGVDADFFSPKREQELGNFCSITHARVKKPTLVFTGVMNYFANEDGVIWFAEKIYPMIRDAVPDVEFFIVGNRPTDKIWNLSEQDGITVTGYVSDIRHYYDLADVCIVPLRIARGLQNKVLEAMASGKAVVATKNASDGIIYQNGTNILIADTVKDFADTVIQLLNHPERREVLGRAARDNAVQHYSWERNFALFEDLLRPS